MVKTLLIIDSSTDDYCKLFREYKTLRYRHPATNEELEEELRVDQASWEDINLSAYSDSSGVVVDIEAARYPIIGSPQTEFRTIKPDFVLIRNPPYGLPTADYRNLLYGFAYGGIPCINSVESHIWNLERPLVHAGLKSIQRRLGKDRFPLINQSYYPNHREMRFTPSYPLVVKVGHVHAGYGKMMVTKPEDFDDLASIMALHSDYCTAEQYVEGEYEIRVQKIGSHYRSYRRVGASSWKANVGSAVLETIPLTEQHKSWIDECATLFGGMDILALDIIHGKDGRDYILECNDSSIGLGPEHLEEDMLIIRDLTMQRMAHTFSGGIKQTGLADTSSSAGYKRLEVELINTDNKKIELEKKVTDLTRQTQEMKEANAQWREYANHQFSKVFTGGLIAGLAIGVLLSMSFVLWRRR